eukprot:6204130-Pleurochrysis_carterae.AAC.2
MLADSGEKEDGLAGSDDGTGPSDGALEAEKSDAASLFVGVIRWKTCCSFRSCCRVTNKHARVRSSWQSVRRASHREGTCNSVKQIHSPENTS